MPNALYYGDNLAVLRDSIATESVDLIYLDPPFNSNASYNVLFKAPSGEGSQAQIEAFEDTWHWNDSAALAFDEVVTGPHSDASIMLKAMRSALGENDMMAYLAMMAVRLIELHRVLKPTGSLYLHCDPTASHYLKLLLDGIFGVARFVNEITWKRSHAHNDAKQGAKHYGRTSDVLLFYSKSDDRTWNGQYTPYSQEYIDRDYRRMDPDGRRYRISDMRGPGGAEKGNPFYERRWIGIDITHLAVALIERRIKEAFPGIKFEVHGVPNDHAGARDLAHRDKHEFQKWITAKIGAQPYKSGKKGMDRGIDGYLHFRDADKKPQFAIVSVKGGENITSGMVRDLKGTMEREKAALGLFLTLNDPTREMEREAASAGVYETGSMKVPRLQILTAAQILDDRRPQVPFGFTEGFKKAGREDDDSKDQGQLL